MVRTCACGQQMGIRLRTLFYLSVVEIVNVPIYSCDACSHTEVIPEVKSHLKRLLARLGSKPDKQKLDFNDESEWAYLISLATDEELAYMSIQAIIRDRIDQLLDLLLLARSLGDHQWEDDLVNRLSQITNPALTT